MSKITTLLKKVEQERERSRGISKGSTVKEHIAIVIFLLLVAINLSLIGMFIKQNKTLSRIDALDAFMNKMSEQIEELSAQIHRATEGINTVEAKTNALIKDIKQIEETNDSQQVSISNLTKAKNNLLERVNSLQIELEKYISANAQTQQ